MKNIIRILKVESAIAILSILIVAPFSFCCDKNESKNGDKIKREYTLEINSGSGFNNEVQCDSFSMKSMNECVIYKNGFSSRIFGNVISPKTNN